MRTPLLALCAALAVALPAFAQAPSRNPGQSQAKSCAAQVRRMQNSPELRVQGGRSDQETRRAGARTFLHEAAAAASRGDERTCREKLGAAQTLMP